MVNKNHFYVFILIFLFFISCENKTCMTNDYTEVCFNLPKNYTLQEKNPDCIRSYQIPCRKYVFENLDYMVEITWDDTNNIDQQFLMYKDIYGFKDRYDAGCQSYIYITEHNENTWNNFERVDTAYSSRAKFVKIIQNKSNHSVVFKFLGYQVDELLQYQKYTESIINSIQIKNKRNLPSE